jgi:oligopeptide/dipeptide ABC transporter ATP-binding protein
VSEPLLRIEDLSVSFAGAQGIVHALSQVTLDIQRGRIIGIVGESGSGKSTLALALLRLLPGNLLDCSGRILLEGTDLLKLSQAQMHGVRGRRIAMIFQDPMSSLNPVFTVETQLIDAQRASRPGLSTSEMRQRAVEMLAKVGIPDPPARLRAYPHQLSGGMRQRAMIAMALLTEPAILIADEATTALDVTIEAQIVALIRALRSDYAGTILFISHSLGLVAELCDEVVVMYAGTVVESGPSAAVFANPQHPYTRALLECELDLQDGADQFVSIPGEVPSLIDPPSGCIFAPRCRSRFDRCLTAPPLIERVSGHRAACWLP